MSGIISFSIIMEKLSTIKTPNSYIRVGANKTLLQQQSLLMVSAHLQEYVKQFFDMGMHKSAAPIRPLFNQYMLEHGIPPFRIYLADMGIRAQNYQTVRQAINEINAVIDYPEVDDEGQPTGKMLVVPVFKQFRVPEHYGYIEVEINTGAARYAFNMAQGYISHSKDIARYATKRSTPPLYFKLLMGHSDRVKLTVPEIKKAIGMEPFRDEKSGEWVIPYQKFAHFKTKVLDAVKADLDQVAAAGHSEITFEYEPIYKADRRRGDPDYVEFTIARVQPKDDTPDMFAQAQQMLVEPDMTEQEVLQARIRVSEQLREQLGLKGGDVWFGTYHQGTVVYFYDRHDPSIPQRICDGAPDAAKFQAIIRQYFGQSVTINLAKQGR